MKTIGALAVAAAIFACTAHASADDDYPDLRGKWVGIADAVSIITSHPGAKPVFESATVTLEITDKMDRRFACSVAIRELRKRIVGVFVAPYVVRWSEADGFVEGKVDGDTIDVCYLRFAEADQLAACETFERQ